MYPKLRSVSLLLLLATLLFAGGILSYSGAGNNSQECVFEEYAKRAVSFEGRDGDIVVEIARSPAKRRCGLSGRRELHDGHGMLFIFEKPELHGIWMKDMDFPIDILWLDRDMRVVDAARNADPESFPKIFRPREPALYVLEVPAGFVEKYGIEIGEKAEISEISTN